MWKDPFCFILCYYWLESHFFFLFSFHHLWDNIKETDSNNLRLLVVKQCSVQAWLKEILQDYVSPNMSLLESFSCSFSFPLPWKPMYLNEKKNLEIIFFWHLRWFIVISSFTMPPIMFSFVFWTSQIMYSLYIHGNVYQWEKNKN